MPVDVAVGPRTDQDVVAGLVWSPERRRWKATDGVPRDESEELRPACSVVICTYERPRSLLRCLNSLREQMREDDEILIVDASRGAETETAIRAELVGSSFVSDLRYFRVRGRYCGLTRQRNFALARGECDLIAFFDDDTVLLPGCLSEMERVHRERAEVVGVGALIQNGCAPPNVWWRLRRLLRAIPDLQPGTYTRSGVSIPWGFLGEAAESCVEGDWLPGGASMWKARVAREVGFYEGFAGYALGEDLDFSLRTRARGRLVMACRARLLHLHEPAGRPDDVRFGYMAIYNRYLIHRRGLPDRAALDVTRFTYASTLDTLFLAANFVFPSRWESTAYQLAGRAKALVHLVLGK